MFEKKVTIYDDFVLIGRKKLMWGQVVGIREHNNPVLRRISNRFPRAEIFLKGGQVVTVSNLNTFRNQSSFHIESEEEDTFESVMTIIRSNAENLNPVFEHWLEWRAVLPIAFVEMIALIFSIAQGRTFQQTVMIMIVAGILGSILGYAWEKSERRKYCR